MTCDAGRGERRECGCGAVVVRGHLASEWWTEAGWDGGGRGRCDRRRLWRVTGREWGWGTRAWVSCNGDEESDWES